MDPKDRRVHLYTFAAIFVVSFAMRLFPAASAVNLSPDVVEYLDQASHNVRGEFGVIAIKRHYFDSYPVVYSGIDDRPPLLPLLAAGVLALTGSVKAVQLFNAILASLAAAVWYLAFRRLVSWRAAAAGTLAGTFSIWFWGPSAFVLTEPLSMLMAALAAWTVAAGAWRRPAGAAALGALCALAYLTRHMNMTFGPAVIGFLVLGTLRFEKGGTVRRAAARSLWVLAVAALLLAPLTVKNAKEFGSPFYDPNRVTLLWGENAFDRYSTPPTESASAFIRKIGPDGYARMFGYSVLRLASALFTGPGGLGLLTLFIPLLAIHLRREAQPPGVWFILGLAALNFAIYSLAGIYGFYDPRFILLTLLPLFPLCLGAVECWPRLAGRSLRIGGRRLYLPTAAVWALAAAAVAQGTFASSVMNQRFPVMTIAGEPVRIYPMERQYYRPADYEMIFERIEAGCLTDDVVATGLPWLVRYFTGRPTALLPVDLDEASLSSYLQAFDVRTVVLDRASLGAPLFGSYLEMFERRSEAGEGEITREGPFVFYRVLSI